MSPQCIISTHSTKVLFLGQLLGISVIFPSMWLPAAFRGQGTGATSKGRVWMAMLTVVPITLVECTGWFQPVAGSFCLFCTWFLNLMGEKKQFCFLPHIVSIVASLSYIYNFIDVFSRGNVGFATSGNWAKQILDKQVHLICFCSPFGLPPCH